MKIVQTFWSAPAKGDLRYFTCSWASPLHHYMSWIVSAYQAKKVYGNVHLVTDTIGKQCLVDAIGIEYDSVSTELDTVPYGHGLWAFPKVQTYTSQTEPFFHIDGDVYLWHMLPDKIMKADVVAQQIESEATGQNMHRVYGWHRPEITKQLPELPDCWHKTPITAYNCGIFGGNNIEAIQAAVQNSKTIIDAPANQTFCRNMNLKVAHSLPANVLIEQMVLKHSCDEKGIHVDTLFHNRDHMEDEYCWRVMGYTHAMSAKFVATPENDFLDRLHARATREYPEHSDRLVRWLLDGKADIENKEATSTGAK